VEGDDLVEVSRGCEGEDFAECGGLEREGFDDGAVEVEDDDIKGATWQETFLCHDTDVT